MKVLDLQGLCAFAAFASLALAILIRRRRLTHEDIGPLFSALMAASTLPVAVHLCSFVLPGQRERGDIVVPDQYAFYIAAAGLILLVSSCVTICQLFAGRMQRDSMPSAYEDRLQTTAALRKSEATAPDQNIKTG